MIQMHGWHASSWNFLLHRWCSNSSGNTYESGNPLKSEEIFTEFRFTSYLNCNFTTISLPNPSSKRYTLKGHLSTDSQPSLPARIFVLKVLSPPNNNSKHITCTFLALASVLCWLAFALPHCFSSKSFASRSNSATAKEGRGRTKPKRLTSLPTFWHQLSSTKRRCAESKGVRCRFFCWRLEAQLLGGERRHQAFGLNWICLRFLGWGIVVSAHYIIVQ